MQKLKIAAVSYINTLPFLKGLELLGADIDLIAVPPAKCASLLKEGKVDIALCPIGALPELDQWYCITDYCIGCDGPVRTVSVFSDHPFSELKSIVLSAESRTSNLLIQLLDREYWKQGLKFVSAGEKHLVQSEKHGYLYIGDICFDKEQEYQYRTDLGESWKAYTGLPFAFACWVSRSEPDPGIEAKLNTAFARGIAGIPLLNQSVTSIDYIEYLSSNISYRLDDAKKEALHRFLDAAQHIKGSMPSDLFADLRFSEKNG